MKNKLGILVVCLFCQIALGQNNSRKPLHGQVVNDSITLESGYVMNLNANIRTFISSNGLFDIMAKPKDTLLITSMAFQSKKIVLTEKNCADRLFLVQMDLVSNQLKEVVVHKDLKVKAFDKNSQAIVDTKFVDDEKSSPKNRFIYDGTIENGVDFVRIFKDAKKLMRKKDVDVVPEEEASDFAFTMYAKANFTPDFYTDTLKLKKEEVDIFLLFCAVDPESKKHLKQEEKFELMDFLITKSQEFKKVNVAGK
ncbi:hypothetical protein [Flavobacterium sp. C3NV]|jgi:hypothetical protein|uniref:hypothetical protein n=1 Tax=Flavobacterium sp. C3NV TaxID=3393358 RepID=UPI0039901EEA